MLAWKVMFSSPVSSLMASLISMLSAMKSSRNGSLSLNHVLTPLVSDPSARLSTVSAGNFASSRFSSSEYVLRGRVLNTTAKAANNSPNRVIYVLLNLMTA